MFDETLPPPVRLYPSAPLQTQEDLRIPAMVTPDTPLLSKEDLGALLAQDSVAERILAKNRFPSGGEKVGVRLNLNIIKSTGQAIQTIHTGNDKEGYRRNKGFYRGRACGYAQAVLLRHAYFNVNQVGREAIAGGEQHKFAMASVDGEFVATAPPADFSGIEVRFNPRTHHLFVDAHHQAIHYAEEVLVLGHRAYARGTILYHTALSAPKRAGTAPSSTLLMPASHARLDTATPLSEKISRPKGY